LNSWPELELGRILREYGEESNWQSVQKQIVKARAMGGLHSTGDLVKLIQRMCCISSGMCDFSTMLPLKVFFFTVIVMQRFISFGFECQIQCSKIVTIYRSVMWCFHFSVFSPFCLQFLKFFFLCSKYHIVERISKQAKRR